MNKPEQPDLPALRAALRQPGFYVLTPAALRHWLAQTQRGQALLAALNDAAFADHWQAFAHSWSDLQFDNYMRDAGRYRKRRHAVCTLDATGELKQRLQLPHYQAVQYNRLNGGVERWFAPIEAHIFDAPIFQALLCGFAELVAPLATDVHQWQAEAHQFRIEANNGQEGLPTPEGVHRDGVDFVLVMMVQRLNIAAGETSLYHPSGLTLGSFVLEQPMQTVILDDHQILHGVTAVRALDANLAAHRDVLVLTLKRA
jgi:hypothetical protein